jgi:hypothetical protein
LNDQTLKPNNNNNENKTTIIQSIQQIATDLNNLLNDPELIIINEQHNEINLFLNKSLRYINSALANENENNHFTSYKLLKSAANTLENFLNDIDNNNSQKNILNKKQKLILTNLIVKLNESSIHIESTSLLLLDLNNHQNNDSASASTTTTTTTTNLLPRSDSHVLNDWVLSEFNLLSNDFNSSLAFIAGNLFDLNFNYKLNKTLNMCSSKCFLMETRNNNTNNLKFVLKCLQKSSNPDLTVKCQVPTLNQVPFMCKLNKYYESDFTIFLLIDYCNFGKLTDYLDILAEHGSSFLNKLKQNSNQNSNNSSSLKSLRRRKSSTISSHKSVSCLVGLDKLSFNNNNNNKTIYRTQSLKDYSPVNTLSKRPQSLTKLTEIQLDNIKYIDESTINIQDKGSSSESSESSESSSRSLSTSESGGKSLESKSTSQKQSNWSNKLLSNSFRKINSLINKNTKLLKTTKILFNNNNNNNNNNTNEIKEIYSSDDNDNNNNNNNDPYLKQVQLWLAQLCLSLKSLHALNIIVKDLRPDNLLLSNDGDCMLTYISRWDLVDEQLNKDAIKFYYAAPELCGSVNYTVTEACDWWSFGVLAYELITMNVRNNNLL